MGTGSMVAIAHNVDDVEQERLGREKKMSAAAEDRDPGPDRSKLVLGLGEKVLIGSQLSTKDGSMPSFLWVLANILGTDPYATSQYWLVL